MPGRYQTGKRLTLSVGIKDLKQSPLPDKKLSLEVRTQYHDSAGKSQRTKQNLELAKLIGGRNRHTQTVNLPSAAKADSKHPIRVSVVLKTGHKETARRSLVVRPASPAWQGPGAVKAKVKSKRKSGLGGKRSKASGEPGKQVANLSVGDRLTVNGSLEPVVVNPGGSVSVRWVVSVGDGALLVVKDTPFGASPAIYCDQSSAPPPSVLQRTYVAGADGSFGLELISPPYELGNSYYVQACAWADSDYAGQYTNTVEMRYQEFVPVELKLRKAKVHRNNQVDTFISFEVKNKSAVTAPDYNAFIDIGSLYDSWTDGSISIPVSGHAGSGGSGSPFIGSISVGDPVREFTVATTELPVGNHRVRILLYWGLDASSNSLNNWLGLQKDLSYTKVSIAGLPDLKVKNVQRSNNNGPNPSISFDIKNAGSAPSAAYRIGYRIGSDSIPNNRVSGVSAEFFEQSGTGLGAGQKRQFLVSNQLPVGNHYLEIFVDSDQQIAEENENNNKKVKQFTKISGGGLPDLTVTNLRRVLNNSSAVRIRFKVKNKGSAPINNYGIRYSTSSGWTVSVMRQDLLGPGDKSGDITVGGSAGIQLPQGSHTLFITLDPDHEIAEENENNNTAQKNFSKL